jgi:hypothetical protein
VRADTFQLLILEYCSYGTAQPRNIDKSDNLDNARLGVDGTRGAAKSPPDIKKADFGKSACLS